MATRKTFNISLTPQLGKFVTSKVAAGQYASASEVVREALRRLEQEERRSRSASRNMREQIDLGFDQLSRRETIDGEQVFQEIRDHSRSVRRRKRAG
ncbi:MAG: type II toxin-antitoxin system ParD family antitoxin [Tepidisphaeraceae bacterium]